MKMKPLFSVHLMLILILTACALPQNDPSFIVGVFGGSISSLSESRTAKAVWAKDLNISVITRGANGKGFSSRTNPNSIPQQIANAPIFDVYILWASTNDMNTASPIGAIGTDDPETQSGGLLKSIEFIRQINSDAQILLFTSLPRFDLGLEGFNQLHEYVLGQIAFCDAYNIPYLDQFSLSGFTWDNYMKFYKADKLHLTRAGYAHIANMQLEFIRKQLQTTTENQKGILK
jgi:lysophospholipase L1-like esterase